MSNGGSPPMHYYSDEKIVVIYLFWYDIKWDVMSALKLAVQNLYDLIWRLGSAEFSVKLY